MIRRRIAEIFLGAAQALLVASLLLGPTVPASAQFVDQATYVAVGNAGGTANAQTFTMTTPLNSYNQLLGVLVKVVPANSNTGATTFNFNGLGTVAVRKLTSGGLAALTGAGNEVVANVPLFAMYDGTFFDIMSGSATTAAVNLANSALGFNAPPNFQINASVTSNALTISVVGNNGSNASAGNPVPVAFRDSTIANGDPVVVSLQAALSFTIASGNTMGCQNSVMCRLWLFAINNGGTIALCAYNANSAGTSIVGLNEQALQSSASGTSGGSSAQTLYCSSSSVSSKAIRYIGFIDIQESTAGTWATGPTYVQLFGPGIKKPGDVVQVVLGSRTSTTSTTGSSFVTTNITASIAPTSAANLVMIQLASDCEPQVGGTQALVYQLQRGATAITTPQNTNFGATSGAVGSCPLLFLDEPSSTSSLAYAAYFHVTGGFSGAMPANAGYIILQEIMGALEPANDNGAPLSEAA